MNRTVLLTLPLGALRHAHAVNRGRLSGVQNCVRTGIKLPPIPIRFGFGGKLLLNGDGNHRLLAYRQEAVAWITVVLKLRESKSRDLARVLKCIRHSCGESAMRETLSKNWGSF